MSKGPLAGIRVLDMGRLVAPAYASSRLSDLGADVVKVELGPNGDYLREVPPLFQGASVLHWELNRGKRSIGLDWNFPEAHDALRRMLGNADVFIDASLGSSAVAMGTDWKTLHDLFPRLVVCSITSFGHDTPYSELRAHGLNIEAAVGLVPVTLSDDHEPLIAQVTHWSASQAAGLTAALSITSALLSRERSNEGTYIEVSCWDCAVSFNYQNVVSSETGGTDSLFPDPRRGFGPRYNAYRTKDDKIVLFAAAEARFWDRFCAVIGRDDLRKSEDGFEYSSGDEEDEHVAIRLEIGLRTQHEWMELATKHRLPITPVHGTEELFGLEQAASSGIFEQRSQLSKGISFQHVAFPARLDGAMPTISRPAPTVGEHSAEILREYGFTEEEVANAIALGAIIGPGADGAHLSS